MPKLPRHEDRNIKCQQFHESLERWNTKRSRMPRLCRKHVQLNFHLMMTSLKLRKGLYFHNLNMPVDYPMFIKCCYQISALLLIKIKRFYNDLNLTAFGGKTSGNVVMIMSQ